MILSSADILRILGGSEIIRLSANLQVVDKKPVFSGREGLYIYIARFPTVVEFEAIFSLWIENDDSEPYDLVISELKRLLPRIDVVEGLLTTVTSTEFRSQDTEEAPTAPPLKEIDASISEGLFKALDTSISKDLLETLREDIQDQMLLVNSGRDGKDGQRGKDGRDGADGTDGQDLAASEVDLEDLRNVGEGIHKEVGQVLTWDGSRWTNRFVPQVFSAGRSGEGGGAQYINDLLDVDTATNPPNVGQVLEWDGTDWIPANQSGGGGTSTGTTILWKFHDQPGTPSHRDFHTDDPDPLLVSLLTVSHVNQNNSDISTLLAAILPNTAKLYVSNVDDPSEVHIYQVDSYTAYQDYYDISVTHLDSPGVELDYVNNRIYSFLFLEPAAPSDLNDIGDVYAPSPADGEVLTWVDADSRWEAQPVVAGIPEAPQDGNYYVRQSGLWVDLASALEDIASRATDGGNFETGTSTGNGSIVDGGNFETGTSTGTNATVDAGLIT